MFHQHFWVTYSDHDHPRDIASDSRGHPSQPVSASDLKGPFLQISSSRVPDSPILCCQIGGGGILRPSGALSWVIQSRALGSETPTAHFSLRIQANSSNFGRVMSHASKYQMISLSYVSHVPSTNLTCHVLSFRQLRQRPSPRHFTGPKSRPSGLRLNEL